MGPEPDIARFACPQRRLEDIRVSLANQAIDAIRTDHEVIIGEAREIIDLCLEADLYAQFEATLRQDIQQHTPGHACERMSTAADDLPLEMNVNRVPDH